MEGSSDVEGDLVGEVYEYLVSGNHCDGASRERKRTMGVAKTRSRSRSCYLKPGAGAGVAT